MLKAAAVWLICGSALSLATGGWAWISVGYFWLFALASILDLWILGMALRTVLSWMENAEKPSEKRTALAIQAFVWGLFKLICVGFLGWLVIAFRGTPTGSLVFGLGSLVVVSLLGGLIWSQRVVRHA